MKNKKGFTLVELMAVIIIISLIAILTFPNIVNQIKKSKKTTTNNINDIVVSAAKRYVADNPNEIGGEVFCLNVSELVSNDYVKDDISKDISNKVVKITDKNLLKYEIVEKKDCKAKKYCNADFCDSHGNKYTQVDYIESLGDSYIDTDYIPVDLNDLKIDYISDIPSNGFIIGLLSNGKYYGIRRNNNASIRWHSATGIYDISTNLQYDTYYNVKQDNDELYIDGIQYEGVKVGENISSLDVSHSLFLFARNNNGKADSFSKVRLKELSIKSNNKIIRNYVPVIDKNKNICLFDKVEEKCSYNLGKGIFISKDLEINKKYYDKEGNQYTKVEYLESTGTQYINTEYNPINFYQLTINYISYIPPIYGNVIGLVSNGQYYGMRRNNDSSIRWHSVTGIYDINVNLSYNVYYNVIQNVDELYIDGIQYNGANYDSTSSLSSSYPLYIFARNNNGNSDCFSQTRLKKLSIKSGNTLIRDYIPVINMNGRPCLFDDVEDKCYYNQGTGEFLYG